MKYTILVAVALAIASTARGQDARLRASLDPETFARVSHLIDSARADGLPTDPLVGAALEGAQRHAPGPRIARVVHDYVAALGSSRAALGAESTASEIVSGAGVVLSGVSPKTLATIRAANPRRGLTIPLVVLADLVTRGVPADTAARAIAAAVRSNARDEDLTALRRFVEQDIVAGASPAAATMLRARNIDGVGPALAAPASQAGVRKP